MSRAHRHVTECRHGGPVSKICSCEHCSLAVCSVCGAYEGSLTTDCPGQTVTFDRLKEVCETNLDYTTADGWHQRKATVWRAPHFMPVDVATNGITANDLTDDLLKEAIADLDTELCVLQAALKIKRGPMVGQVRKVAAEILSARAAKVQR